MSTKRKPAARKNGLGVGKNANDSILIAGNSNTVQVFNPKTLYNLEYLAPLLTKMLETQQDLSSFFRDALNSAPGNNLGMLFKKYDLLHILAEFKKQDPAKYEQFIADGISSALGVPLAPIRQADAFAHPIKPGAAGPTLYDAEEGLDFQDRTSIVSDIFVHNKRYFVLYGPSGIGKSHLLAHIKAYTCFAPTRAQVRCVDVDLSACHSSADILPQAISKLGGDKDGGLNEFARLITLLQREEPPINQILFLFDWDPPQNPVLIEWLLGPQGLIEDPGLHSRLEAFGAKGLINLKVVIAAHHPMQGKTPGCTPEPILVGPLPADSIPAMLQDLAKRRKLPVTTPTTEKIGRQIHYLTGGHPKCAKLISLEIAKQGFAEPSADLWRNYFNDYALGVMQKDVLSAIHQPLVVETLWRLSVFRRFDQRLLASLMGRKVIAEISTEKDISRQARELRAILKATYLISELDSGTQTMNLNLSLRRVLALGLEYNSPQLYQAINAEALKIFAERLHDVDNSLPRELMFLMEFIYHMITALKINPQITPQAVCVQMCQTLDEYLPIAFAVIKPAEQDDFPQLLQAAWESDEELAVLIRYGAGENCLALLTGQINNFCEQHTN